MTTVYSKLNNPSNLTSVDDSLTFMIKNADVDLKDKINPILPGGEVNTPPTVFPPPS